MARKQPSKRSKGSSSHTLSPRPRPQLRSSPLPARIRLRSVPAPPRPRPGKTAKKKKYGIMDLSDALQSRIFDFCNLKNVLDTRSLSTLKDAVSLACTNTRLFNVFRARLRSVDAFTPARRGYPPPCLPDFLAQREMSWIARLASENLLVLRLPDYLEGSADVMLAVEYCCRELREVSFTDAGSIYASLSTSLFNSCKRLTTVEIRGPTRSTIQALWKGQANFEEVTLLDVDVCCVRELCELIGAKGLHMNVFRVAFNLQPQNAAQTNVPFDEEGFKVFTSFCEYVNKHAFQELPRLAELDISTSPYHVIEHERCNTLESEKWGVSVMSSLAKLMERERNMRRMRAKRGGRRGIGLLRLRCVYMSELGRLLRACVPLREADKVHIDVPGAGVLHDLRTGEGWLTRLQLGAHMTGNAACDIKGLEVVDLGGGDMAWRYDGDAVVRKEVGKLLIRACGVGCVRAVFGLEKSREAGERAWRLVRDGVKLAMVARVVVVSHELLVFGDGCSADFRGMVGAWAGAREIRLVNGGRHGGGGAGMTERDCVGFLCGVMWVTRLLESADARVRRVVTEDLGRVRWRNGPRSRVTLAWCRAEVWRYSRRCAVDCSTVLALLARWRAQCV